VTDFADDTQEQLDELTTFVDDFFQCTSYVPVVWRGLRDQTAGYVFDLGNNTTIKWSALDVSDVGEEAIEILFYSLKPTDKCEAFAQ
jgi:hypothetical protein